MIVAEIMTLRLTDLKIDELNNQETCWGEREKGTCPAKFFTHVPIKFKFPNLMLNMDCFIHFATTVGKCRPMPYIC
jgi:hypothetical protein